MARKYAEGTEVPADRSRSEIEKTLVRFGADQFGYGTKQDAQTADDSYVAATLKYERLRAERQRAELLIDVWRTLEASRRKS